MHASFTITPQTSAAPTAEVMFTSYQTVSQSFVAGTIRYVPIVGTGSNGTPTDPTVPANNNASFATQMPIAGTFSLFSALGTLPGAFQSRTFAVHVNGADSTLNFTMDNTTTDGHGNGYVLDSVHSVHVNALDLVAFLLDGTNDAVAWKGTFSMKFVPD